MQGYIYDTVMPLTESETWYCKYCVDVFGPGTYVDRAESVCSGLPDLDSQICTTASVADEQAETPTSPPEGYRTFADDNEDGGQLTTPEGENFGTPNADSPFITPLTSTAVTLTTNSISAIPSLTVFSTRVVHL